MRIVIAVVSSESAEVDDETHLTSGIQTGSLVTATLEVAREVGAVGTAMAIMYAGVAFVDVQAPAAVRQVTTDADALVRALRVRASGMSRTRVFRCGAFVNVPAKHIVRSMAECTIHVTRVARTRIGAYGVVTGGERWAVVTLATTGSDAIFANTFVNIGTVPFDVLEPGPALAGVGTDSIDASGVLAAAVAHITLISILAIVAIALEPRLTGARIAPIAT